MKIRNRLSFFQGASSDDANDDPVRPLEEIEELAGSDDSPEAKVAAESETPASDASPATQESPSSTEFPPVSTVDEPNANRMRGAFAAVAQVVVGEVESARRAVGELDKTIARRVELEKEARTTAVDALQRELASRIDEQIRAQEKAVEELKQAAERQREQVDDRVGEVREALEQTVASKMEKLEAELDGLAKNVAALQAELQRQIETSERVTGLLNNMAGVFSPNQPSGAPPRVSAAAGAVTTSTSEDSKVRGGDADPQEVDDALQRVFK